MYLPSSISSSFEYSRWKLSSQILLTLPVLLAASFYIASIPLIAAESLPDSRSCFSMVAIMAEGFKFLFVPSVTVLSDPLTPEVPTFVAMAPIAGELCLPDFDVN